MVENGTLQTPSLRQWISNLIQERWGTPVPFDELELKDDPPVPPPFASYLVEDLNLSGWLSMQSKDVAYTCVISLVDVKPTDKSPELWKDEQANRIIPYIIEHYVVVGSFHAPEILAVKFDKLGNKTQHENLCAVTVVFQVYKEVMAKWQSPQE